MKFNVGDRVKVIAERGIVEAGQLGTVGKVDSQDPLPYRVTVDGLKTSWQPFAEEELELVRAHEPETKPIIDAEANRAAGRRVENAISEARANFRNKAQNASRRTNVDKVMGLQTALKMVKVAPDAHLWKPNMTADEARDYILCRVPDLLDMAVFCHYEIGSEAK